MQKEKYRRPSWDEYFLRLAQAIGARATCADGSSGAVIVGADRRILTTGYRGSLPGLAHCDAGHIYEITKGPRGGETKKCVKAMCASRNAICQAARYGIALKDATLYTQKFPCALCLKAIISVGIKRLVVAKKTKITPVLINDLG